MGGGFGSKLEPGKYTVIAALLARRIGRPVKAFLTREETFLVARQPAAQRDDAEGRGEEGRHAHGAASARRSARRRLPGRRGRSATDRRPLPLPERDGIEDDERLHQRRQGAGVPGARVPAGATGRSSRRSTRSAEKLGLDPVELRLKNVPTVSQLNDNAAVHLAPASRSACTRARRRSAGPRRAAAPGERPAPARRRRRGRDVGLRRRPAATAIVTLVRRRQRQPQHRRQRPRHRHQDGDGDGRRRGARRAARAHPGRARRHRDHQVRAVPPAAARPCSSTRRRCARRRSRSSGSCSRWRPSSSKAGRRPRRRATARWSSAARDRETKVAFAELKGLQRAATMLVGVGPRHPHPEGKVGAAVRRALRRGRGRHPHRRGAGRCASSPRTTAAA